MGVETVITCERCGKESRYPLWPDVGLENVSDEWAGIYPETAVPYTYGTRHAVKSATVCNGCLTDHEREQVVESRRKYEAEQSEPF